MSQTALLILPRVQFTLHRPALYLWNVLLQRSTSVLLHHLLSFFNYSFILAAPGLCCSKWYLSLQCTASLGIACRLQSTQVSLLCSTWDLSSLTRGRTWAPALQGGFLATGSPGESPPYLPTVPSRTRRNPSLPGNLPLEQLPEVTFLHQNFNFQRKTSDQQEAFPAWLVPRAMTSFLEAITHPILRQFSWIKSSSLPLITVIPREWLPLWGPLSSFAKGKKISTFL